MGFESHPSDWVRALGGGAAGFVGHPRPKAVEFIASNELQPPWASGHRGDQGAVDFVARRFLTVRSLTGVWRNTEYL